MASSSILLLVSSLVIVLLLTWNIQAQTNSICSTDFVISHQGNPLVEVGIDGSLQACPATNGNLQNLCSLINVTSFLGNKVVGCNGNAFLKSFSLFNETTCAIPLVNTSCTTAGQYVTGFDSNGNPQCSIPTASKTCTTAGQYITGFDASGNPQCSSPTAGKTCTTAGQYITGFDASGNPQCSPPTANKACTTPGQYITGFDASGNPQCSTPPSTVSKSCTTAGQYITGFDANDNPVCSAPTGGKSCTTAGQFITGFDASGNPQCSTPASPTAGRSCTTAGQYISGFDANGNPVCSAPTGGKSCTTAGQFITGFDASGNPQCSTPPYGKPNFQCGSGGYVSGFDSMGNPQCTTPQLTISPSSICGSGYTVNNGQLVLTDGGTGEHASAYFNTQYDFTSGFYIRFTVTITHNGGTQADGFALVVQNDPSGCGAVGTQGGGVGYEGIINAFAVEFDTYKNGDHNDPNSNHVGIQASAGLGGAISANHGSAANVIAAPVSLPTGVLGTTLQVMGTSVLQVVVSFNPASQTLSVSLGGTNIYDEVPSKSIFNVLQLNSARIGFTSSTGAYTEGVTISDFNLQVPYIV